MPMKKEFECGLALALALSLMAAGCDDSPASSAGGVSGTDTEASMTTTTTTLTAADGGADTSGGQVDTTSAPNECEDDYHGNNSALDLLDLGLDTTSTAVVVLGDGVVSSPVEQGGDELVVCGGEGDYFSFDLACDSYLAKVTLRDVYTALGSPSLLAIGNRTEAPGCVVEQAVNAALGESFDAAEALLLEPLGEVTLAALSEDARARVTARDDK